MLDFSVLNSGGNHNLREFAALVERCTVVIAPDTLAMHLAIALKKPVIALFGPTCHQEVELYTLGKKIISNIECAPCYKNTCDKVFTCMDKIKLMDIVVAAKELVNLKVVARI
jgi:heptosyltransferase-2